MKDKQMKYHCSIYRNPYEMHTPGTVALSTVTLHSYIAYINIVVEYLCSLPDHHETKAVHRNNTVPQIILCKLPHILQ